jgi:predicted O-methyltransferase YrrM
MTRDEYDKLYHTRANNNCDGHAHQHYGFWMQQHPDEFWGLVEAVSSIGAKRILEIGVNHGGSTVFWDHLVGPDGLVVALDKYGFTGNYMSMFRPEFCTYLPKSNLQLLAEDSHLPETVGKIQQLFPDGIDFLFIDGDHSYLGVKTDYENYSPLVRPGGLVAFHDTLMAADDKSLDNMGVSKFFRELDAPKKRIDIAFGIGIVYL